MRQADDAVALHHHGGRAQQVVQLAHIARPTIAAQQCQGLGRDLQWRALRLAQSHQQGMHHGIEIAAFAQRWQAHHQAIEAVVKVFTKLTARHQLLEVFVRGAHHGHVHLQLFAGTQGGDFALLQHTQQAGLQVARHVANFIKKQRAAVGLEDFSWRAFLACAGERALFVAKQLGLDQALGNRGTVHRHKGLLGACRVVVEGPRQQVFARAGFAQNHHTNAAIEHLAQLGNGAGQLGIARVQRLQRGAQGGPWQRPRCALPSRGGRSGWGWGGRCRLGQRTRPRPGAATPLGTAPHAHAVAQVQLLQGVGAALQQGPPGRQWQPKQRGEGVRLQSL